MTFNPPPPQAIPHPLKRPAATADDKRHISLASTQGVTVLRHPLLHFSSTTTEYPTPLQPPQPPFSPQLPLLPAASSHLLRPHQSPVLPPHYPSPQPPGDPPKVGLRASMPSSLPPQTYQATSVCPPQLSQPLTNGMYMSDVHKRSVSGQWFSLSADHLNHEARMFTGPTALHGRINSGGNFYQHGTGESPRLGSGFGTGETRMATGETRMATGESRFVSGGFGERRYRSAGGEAALWQSGRETEEMRIVGERLVEREIKVPTVKRRESIRERVVTIPERVIKEEIIEEVNKIRERVIQVEQPHWIERRVEYPEEEIVLVPRDVWTTDIQWVERRVEKPVVETKIVQNKKVYQVEKIVNFPVDQPVDKPILKLVEVPEVRFNFLDVPRPVNTYKTVDVPVYKEQEVISDVSRRVPVGIEQVTEQEYEVTQLKSEIEEVPYFVYLPYFTEVPVPADQLTEEALYRIEELNKQIVYMASMQMPSLCVVEELAIKGRRMVPDYVTDPHVLVDRYSAKVRALPFNEFMRH